MANVLIAAGLGGLVALGASDFLSLPQWAAFVLALMLGAALYRALERYT